VGAEVTPYYSDDAVTIYHGDCREILPTLDLDVIVTDPPYGISIVSSNGTIGGVNQATVHSYAPVTGDTEPLDPCWLTEYGRRQVIFGMEHFVVWPGPGRALVWEKRWLKPTKFGDAELAWDSERGATRLIRYLSNGFWTDWGDIDKCHPTQKPLGVMHWIIDECSEKDDTVCDPFMGSGTTLRAAKDYNRKAIGIEIEESYCEIAANRMAQEVLAL
jgi:hypothetical protein